MEEPIGGHDDQLIFMLIIAHQGERDRDIQFCRVGAFGKDGKGGKTGIVLEANTKLALGDIVMEVGAVTESVEVAATATALQTESVERSATITGKQIENIEVNGRNPLDMAKLVPGVSFSPGSNYAVGNSGTGANQFAVNGARPSQNQLSLNGIGNGLRVPCIQ